MDWGIRWLVYFNAGKTEFVLFLWSNNTGAIDIKMDESVLEENSCLKMLELILDWGPYIISITETAVKKIRVLIRSMKFLSLEVARYLHTSSIRLCIGYCCHVWVGAPSC